MRVRPVIYIVPLALLLLAILGGSPLVMRLFFASLAVLAIGYVWARLGLSGVKVSIGELPEHCQVGDRLDQQITIDNDSKIPKLFLRAEQDTTFPGHEKVRLLNLGAGGTHRWASDINCTRRGRYAARLGHADRRRPVRPVHPPQEPRQHTQRHRLPAAD